MRAEPASGGKVARPVGVCHVLQVVGRLDAGLAEMARAQAGMVHRRQLIELEIGRGAIAHRLKARSLHRVLPLVYAVAHPGLTRRAMLVAALLYAGADCVISDDTGAELWGLGPEMAGEVRLTACGRHVQPVPGVCVHRTSELDRSEVRLKDGLPVTSPARTLIDQAGRHDDDLVAAQLGQARVLGLVTQRELHAALALHPNRPGVARLKRVLASDGGPTLTRSEAERRLHRLLAAAQLPPAEANARVAGCEVDFLWRAQLLVVEVDGRQFHAHPAAFERDRRRDQTMLAAGYRVLRVTWRQLVEEPIALAVRIGQALALAESQLPG